MDASNAGCSTCVWSRQREKLVFVCLYLWKFEDLVQPLFPKKKKMEETFLLYCFVLFSRTLPEFCGSLSWLNNVLKEDLAWKKYLYYIIWPFAERITEGWSFPRILPVCTFIVEINSYIYLYEHSTHSPKVWKIKCVWFFTLDCIADLAFWAIPCREILP